MRDLQKIFEECLDNVRTLNIPIGEIESIQWARFRKRWGRCTKHSMTNTFSIKIAARCKKEDISLSDLKSIICHEILHTCDGGINHSKVWVQYALKIDRVYGYGVSIYKTPFDFFNHDLPVLHKMECKNCGGSWEIKNPLDWEKIQNGAVARCGWCGEKF